MKRHGVRRLLRKDLAHLNRPSCAWRD